MNTKAAQTMPTVPQAFFDEFGVNADDRVMDYGRACYEAGLNAGRHPDALPDGTLSKSTAKRVEVLAAASVSERARELLAAEYRTHGWHEDAGRLCMGGDPTSFVEDDALRVIDRLVVDVAKAWQEGYRQGVLDERTSEDNIGIAGFGAKVEPARNNPYALAHHPALAAIAAWQYAPATTPKPSADAVRELVLLSRGLAKRTFNRSTAEMYIHFADELESLLSGGSHA